ncbi:hypothetical protein SK128_012740 [Halocaridina rubra]|uniref:Major facilitator superfamily (MFS) profile domain-containing protein n=1 Tax=Halocaridina rubra TaxID=373956 RepID=A0AAN8WND6_HALRR
MKRRTQPEEDRLQYKKRLHYFFTDILRWIIVMTAMVMISTNYMMSYVWAPELYPTVVRSRGCCSCALAGHLGFFVTPFVTDVLAKHIWWVPSFVFASSGYIAACLVFLLPETKGLSLCETVQDIEKRWKSQKEMGYAQRSCLSGVKNCYA